MKDIPLSNDVSCYKRIGRMNKKNGWGKLCLLFGKSKDA